MRYASSARALPNYDGYVLYPVHTTGHTGLVLETALYMPVELEGTPGLILQESLILFAERGYGATTVRDIAERVGILSGSLYAHFSSKEEILARLIEIGMIEHHGSIHTAVLAAAPDPRSQLIELMRTHVEFHARYATLAKVVHAEMHILSPSKTEHINELREQTAIQFQNVVDRGVQAGVFTVADPEIAATAIASIGVRVASWYTPEFRLDVATLSAQLAELAVRIVSAP